MIKLVKKEKTIKKQKHIRQLQYTGKIKVYYDAVGYIAYDTEEYAAYIKTRKIGRPCKGKEKNND